MVVADLAGLVDDLADDAVPALQLDQLALGRVELGVCPRRNPARGLLVVRETGARESQPELVGMLEKRIEYYAGVRQ